MSRQPPDVAVEARFCGPVPDQVDPVIEALVREIIGQVADKWTMLILETLEEHGTLRFTQIGRLVGGISQKMLTKTVRQMECDGLLTRVVHPVVPPRVDYALTELGRSLGGRLLRRVDLGGSPPRRDRSGAAGVQGARGKAPRRDRDALNRDPARAPPWTPAMDP